ncbi:hypothetical protein SMSP2_01392 [Limihaloglobus sulfuriphilus]|uniref:GH141-like insertion domain-containing protein n=2 Tax=Limihaloglobus sulfuriphilus TaxID=1851148 RepID=A0A1Q2MEQ9_9BACT|nr:hypothetical protein SMSP2_01392 [Limihaloglobus sulfuriphilus]
MIKENIMKSRKLSSQLIFAKSLSRAALLILVLAAIHTVPAGEWPRYIDVYRGSTPKLDGILSKGEYDDASLITGVGGWNEQFVSSGAAKHADLSVKCFIKHDGENLFFAFDITDDVLYGIETDRWAPDENPDHVHDLTKAGFPWFGDGVELLINASYTWPKESGKFNYGDARSWQVVCNHSKSLLGGIGKGGLIQGEQRDSPIAWENHEKWIRSGAMKAVTKVKPDKKGYIAEWMVSPQCLQVDKNKEIFWSPQMGIVKMGLNIGIQDLDYYDTAPQNWGRFHHESWWAGERDYRTEPRQWGTMYVHPDYKITTDFYVSVKGKDTYPGTKRKPFFSIKRAQQAVRELTAAGLKNNITVYIKDGTYNITEPLTFIESDGGNIRYTVTYKAYPGHSPLISGGRTISDWQRVKGNLWKTHIPEVKSGKWLFRDLFKDGRRMTIARYPNIDDSYLYIVDINEEKDTVVLPNPLPEGDYWDSEIVVLHLWAESIAKIRSLEKANLIAENPIGYIGHGALDAQVGRKLYLQNSIEFLDKPQEYFLDRKTGTLFYMAAKGENPNRCEFTAPIADKLIVIEGTKNNPVKNLIIEGISFEYTKWLLPEEGFNEGQSGHWGSEWGKIQSKGLPAAIELKYAEGVKFDGCRLAHTGAHGIGLKRGTRENMILGCDIYDIAGNGVMVGQRMKPCSNEIWFNVDWQDPSDAPYKNRISSNTIIKAAQVMHSCVGVFDAYADGTSITHNLIKDLPYIGISIGFNWGYAPTSQKNTFVSYNEICDNMQLMFDGAGIYTLGLQPGTVISNNFIHDVKNAHGLYTDEGSQLILFENNIVYGVGDCAYQHHHGYNNIFRNNIFADARVNYVRRLREDEKQSFWLDRNIFWITGGRVLNGSWTNGLYKFTDNIYWITRGTYPLQFVDMTHGWIGDWQNMGHDQNGMFANPLFKDPQNRDFTMPADSPAVKAGFKPIYLENAGPIK